MKKKPSWIKCSHKAIEWREYIEKKEKGDGVFPPQKFCDECETSAKLKSTPMTLLSQHKIKV